MTKIVQIDRLEAVTGSQYGDEGKGRCVDWLTRRTEAGLVLNVRHNSSCQAGHTVVTPDGRRHVFSHVGSGTLAGAVTLLAHKFVMNPLVFNEEWDELTRLGVIPQVYVADKLNVTTPCDVALNRWTEQQRSYERHGSCGMGFGETIQRTEEAESEGEESWTLTLKTKEARQHASAITARTLEEIEKRELATFNHHDAQLIRDLRENGIQARAWVHFFDQFDLLRHRVNVVEDVGGLVRSVSSHVIFEGAQGLLLHQDHGNFPHVTRCRTGLEDVLEFLSEIDAEPKGFLKSYNCARSYNTRHGAGPMPGQVSVAELEGDGYRVEDLTNKPNPWQENLRYARFDAEAINDAVNEDAERLGRVDFSIDYGLVISCCDQAPKRIVDDIVEQSIDNFDELYTCYSPTHEETVHVE